MNSIMRPSFKLVFVEKKVFAAPVNNAWDPLKTPNVGTEIILVQSKRRLNEYCPKHSLLIGLFESFF